MTTRRSLIGFVAATMAALFPVRASRSAQAAPPPTWPRPMTATSDPDTLTWFMAMNALQSVWDAIGRDEFFARYRPVTLLMHPDNAARIRRHCARNLRSEEPPMFGVPDDNGRILSDFGPIRLRESPNQHPSIIRVIAMLTVEQMAERIDVPVASVRDLVARGELTLDDEGIARWRARRREGLAEMTRLAQEMGGYDPPATKE